MKVIIYFNTKLSYQDPRDFLCVCADFRFAVLVFSLTSAFAATFNVCFQPSSCQSDVTTPSRIFVFLYM